LSQMKASERDYRMGTRKRIKGPGTTTSDSVPAMLSKGEFVIKASSAAKIGDKTLNHMNRTGRVPMNTMMQNMKQGRLRGKRRVKMGWGGLLGRAAMVAAPLIGGYKAYQAAKGIMNRQQQPPAQPPATGATPAPAPNPNQGGVRTPLNAAATNALERRMRAAGMAKGGKAGMKCMACGGKMAVGGRCMKCGGKMKGYAAGGSVGSQYRALTKRGPEDSRLNGFTTFGFAKGGKMMGLRAARRPMAGGGHPGFKAVQAKIAAKQGIPMKRAGAILAASSRRASPAAKRANPRLNRVKG
jgi:hypothetical protein